MVEYRSARSSSSKQRSDVRSVLPMAYDVCRAMETLVALFSTRYCRSLRALFSASSYDVRRALRVP